MRVDPHGQPPCPARDEQDEQDESGPLCPPESPVGEEEPADEVREESRFEPL
ncbi:hypothetical protein [Streptomyces sp. SID13726]|uniref:hypothetical protein n=1 Tax=Streptomyces sp. SID13726 TaxID=2706058 RepID=UPI0013BAAFD1|nr:hypothetical protein [Streptomyces sp. SID13726]NEA98545.1 hypothetical protein [Streptomyces sp. SID13726]